MKLKNFICYEMRYFYFRWEEIKERNFYIFIIINNNNIILI